MNLLREILSRSKQITLTRRRCSQHDGLFAFGRIQLRVDADLFPDLHEMPGHQAIGAAELSNPVKCGGGDFGVGANAQIAH